MNTDSIATFRSAYENFVPDATDNPDCVPFYRTFHGARAVFGVEFVSKFNSEIHEACCWACHEKDAEETLRALCAALADRARKIKLPDAPRNYSSYWKAEPKEPDEADARNLFVSEFKRTFPGERANSKHANELWKVHREKAVQIVRERYAKDVEAHRVAEDAERTRRSNVEAEWLAKCAAVRAYVDEVGEALMYAGYVEAT